MKTNTITQIQIHPDQLINAIANEIEKRISFKKTMQIKEPPNFEKIPIKWLFDKKIISRSSLYKKVKTGEIKIQKLGGRTYVDRVQFNSIFHEVSIEIN
jgi:hypothetical protein